MARKVFLERSILLVILCGSNKAIVALAKLTSPARAFAACNQYCLSHGTRFSPDPTSFTRPESRR